MKKILLISLVFCFGFVSIQNEPIIDSKELEAVNMAFSELNEVLQKENGQLWNYSLQGPLMFVNRETRTLYANEPDTKGEFVKHGNMYIGKLPENITIANTACNWNNKRWTMVVLPIRENNEECLELMLHESFHRIQPLIGFDSFNEKQNNHLDSKDGRIYVRLELEALKKALQSKNPHKHIRNALLFRHYRHQLFPDAKNNENSVELNEGLAEYTGTFLSQPTDESLRNRYISSIQRVYVSPTFVRSFPYIPTSIYGFFMQKVDTKWNLKITKHTNLTDFFSEFYEVPQSRICYKKIMQIGKEYGVQSIIQSESEREEKRKQQQTVFIKRFINDSAVVINLKNHNMSFNPNIIIPLDTLGTVFPYVRIVDNWGILEVDSCGALISADWSKVTVTCPTAISESVINGEGWELRLNNDWKLNRINSGYLVIRK